MTVIKFPYYTFKMEVKEVVSGAQATKFVFLQSLAIIIAAIRSMGLVLSNPCMLRNFQCSFLCCTDYERHFYSTR